VTIKRDTPITITTADLIYDGFDNQKVLDTFKDLGFNSLISRLGGETEETEKEMEDIEYTVVQDITSDMLTKESAFVVELLQENYHQAQIEGIGIVTEKENLFIPLKVALESSMFKKWAEDPAYKKSVFDAKKTLVAFMRHGIHIKGI